MMFKVGDLVKIIGYQEKPEGKISKDIKNIPVQNAIYLHKIGIIKSIDIHATWRYDIYLPSLDERYGVSEYEITLAPICRTEIYKALTEET